MKMYIKEERTGIDETEAKRLARKYPPAIARLNPASPGWKVIYLSTTSQDQNQETFKIKHGDWIGGETSRVMATLEREELTAAPDEEQQMKMAVDQSRPDLIREIAEILASNRAVDNWQPLPCDEDLSKTIIEHLRTRNVFFIENPNWPKFSGVPVDPSTCYRLHGRWARDEFEHGDRNPVYADPEPNFVGVDPGAGWVEEGRKTHEALSGFHELIGHGIVEANKAITKFPQPNYVLSKFIEEAGESHKAMIHYAEGRDTREHVLDELKQTIAMIYRLWIEGDEVHGVPALKEEWNND